ncbi:methyltransferase [Spirochaetia bacterium]|nr:methyltransferase [Spirochaetia bacterium]
MVYQKDKKKKEASVNMINTFTNKTTLYSRYRQNYSCELIQHLYANVGFQPSSCIADIGAGTGMFTELLLQKGSTVFAVEPNNSMRQIAESALSKYPSFHSVNTAGESTSLQPRSIDFVTVAQAFHWLNGQLFKMECQRLTKCCGKIIIVYNRKRKDAEINRELAEIISKFYPKHNDIINHWELRENPIIEFFNGKYEFLSFENNIVNNLDEFIGRSLSASYAVESDAYVNRLRNLFCSYEKDGLITMPSDSIAYIGEV